MFMEGRVPGSTFRWYPTFRDVLQFRKRIDDNTIVACAADNSLEYVFSHCPCCKNTTIESWFSWKERNE